MNDLARKEKVFHYLLEVFLTLSVKPPFLPQILLTCHSKYKIAEENFIMNEIKETADKHESLNGVPFQ